jgi:hypothetical protein
MVYSGTTDGTRNPFEPVDDLVPAHALKHGIIRYNYLLMRQRAFNKAYKMQVPTDCMVVVDVLINMPLIGEETNATNLKKRVSKVLERQTSGPALEAIKECLRRDMIAFKKRGATKIYGMTPEQNKRSEDVSYYMQKFPEVISAQIASPTDSNAGRDLLNCDDVYFNIAETYKEKGTKKKGSNR